MTKISLPDHLSLGKRSNDQDKNVKPFNEDEKYQVVHPKDPKWSVGDGANDGNWKKFNKIDFDPYAEGRNPVSNYKLLISAITPRFIGFISTVSQTGIENLAPFSYTTIVNNDPPIFCIGIAGDINRPKDTLANILANKELTINVVSEWFTEAMNATSVNAPPEVSEWDISGLHPANSIKVKPPHVAESAFSIEAKLIHHHVWKSRKTGANSGVLLIVEGIHFHARQDAVNEEKSFIDPGVLKPVSRLGGTTYGRTTSGYDIPRPAWKD